MSKSDKWLTAKLAEIVPGPDFPSGGVIVGTEGISAAYGEGRGGIKVRAKAEVVKATAKRDRIVVTELPYMVGPERVCEQIAKLIENDKLPDVSSCNDLSDRQALLDSPQRQRKEDEKMLRDAAAPLVAPRRTEIVADDGSAAARSGFRRESVWSRRSTPPRGETSSSYRRRGRRSALQAADGRSSAAGRRGRLRPGLCRPQRVLRLGRGFPGALRAGGAEARRRRRRSARCGASAAGWPVWARSPRRIGPQSVGRQRRRLRPGNLANPRQPPRTTPAQELALRPAADNAAGGAPARRANTSRANATVYITVHGHRSSGPAIRLPYHPHRQPRRPDRG